MGITVTDLGTAADTVGAACTIANVTIPASATIFVWIYETNNTGNAGFVNDAVNGRYGSIVGGFPNNFSSNGICGSFYVAHSQPLNNANITYTKNVSGTLTQMSALYATDIDDITFGEFTTGLSTNPSISLNATANGSLIIGAVAFLAVAGDTFTQDSSDGPYAIPPDSLIVANNGIAGGNFVKATAGSIAYSPTINHARQWAAFQGAFDPTPLFHFINVG